MLEVIRKHVSGILAKILIGLLILSFAVWGIGDIFTFQMGSTVARVGDTEITAERFADTMYRQQQLITQLQSNPTYASLSATDQATARAELIEQVFDNGTSLATVDEGLRAPALVRTIR